MGARRSVRAGADAGQPRQAAATHRVTHLPVAEQWAAREQPLPASRGVGAGTLRREGACPGSCRRDERRTSPEHETGDYVSGQRGFITPRVLAVPALAGKICSVPVSPRCRPTRLSHPVDDCATPSDWGCCCHDHSHLCLPVCVLLVLCALLSFLLDRRRRWKKNCVRCYHGIDNFGWAKRPF